MFMKKMRNLIHVFKWSCRCCVVFVFHNASLVCFLFCFHSQSNNLMLYIVFLFIEFEHCMVDDEMFGHF